MNTCKLLKNSLREPIPRNNRSRLKRDTKTMRTCQTYRNLNILLIQKLEIFLSRQLINLDSIFIPKLFHVGINRRKPYINSLCKELQVEDITKLYVQILLFLDISGVPGIGKTICVDEVLKRIER